jgi:hypothetical protein
LSIHQKLLFGLFGSLIFSFFYYDEFVELIFSKIMKTTF